MKRRPALDSRHVKSRRLNSYHMDQYIQHLSRLWKDLVEKKQGPSRTKNATEASNVLERVYHSRLPVTALQ